MLLGVGSARIALGHHLRALQVWEVVLESARWLRTWRLSSLGMRSPWPSTRLLHQRSPSDQHGLCLAYGPKHDAKRNIYAVIRS